VIKSQWQILDESLHVRTTRSLFSDLCSQSQTTMWYADRDLVNWRLWCVCRTLMSAVSHHHSDTNSIWFTQ